MESSSEKGTLYHELLEKIDFLQTKSVLDVTQFIDCNYSGENCKILHEFIDDNIYKNISLLKEYISDGDRVLKEQKFVMRALHSDMVIDGQDEIILIQGVMDLIIIKSDKIILFDYKLTNGSDEYIKQKYAKQIAIYKHALSKKFKNISIECYILNLNSNKILEIN